MKKIIFSVCCFLLGCPMNIMAQDVCLGNISATLCGGSPKLIAPNHNGYVYCSKSSALEIYSVDNPTAPVLERSYQYWPDPNCFEIRNDYGMIGCSMGLWVFDLGNPIYPQDRCLITSMGNVNSIALTDSFAYVLSDTALYILEISNRFQPTIIGSRPIAKRCFDIKVNNGSAFIACDSTGMIVVDISDPHTISVLDTASTEWPTSDIFVEGNYAYLLENFNFYPVEDSRLAIFDVSIPSQANRVGTAQFDGNANSIYIQQNIAFIGGTNSILSVVNVADPSNPILVDSLPDLDWINDIKISDNIGYVAGSGGLYVLDLSSIANPQIIDHEPIFLPCTDVFVSGDYAYVASYITFYIVDISFPNLPMVRGSCEINGFQGREIFVQGDSAYIASFMSGTIVVNIADPDNPFEAGHLPLFGSGASRGICINGNYAYESGTNLGLTIVDLTGTYSPVLYPTPGTAWNVEVTGGYAYVADADYLTIINVADPLHPSNASQTRIAGTAWDLCVAGEYVYVAALDSGLQIYDISNPYNPSFAGECYTHDRARGVKVQGNYALVADSDSGLVAINIADPAGPFLATSNYRLYDSRDLFIADSIIFVTSWDGLYLFRLGWAGISDDDLILPNNLLLSDNYPNPFNSSTVINYSLANTENVKIEIFDILGRKIQTLVDQRQSPGYYNIFWNSTDLISGIYFYQIQAGKSSQTKKCLLLR
jgi:hypothetical protein